MKLVEVEKEFGLNIGRKTGEGRPTLGEKTNKNTKKPGSTGFRRTLKKKKRS